MRMVYKTVRETGLLPFAVPYSKLREGRVNFAIQPPKQEGELCCPSIGSVLNINLTDSGILPARISRIN